MAKLLDLIYNYIERDVFVELIEKFETKNHYKTKNWDTEHTFKYIFKSNDKLIETGYFIHYKDNEEVKKVIELSSSYGCPMKCKFCASEMIKDFKLIRPKELIEIVDYIFSDNNIDEDEKLLIALAGTGDLVFTLKNTTEFIFACNKKYRNLYFDVSTMQLNEEMVKEFEKIKDTNLIRDIRITFVLNDNGIEELIPYMKDKNYSFGDVTNLILKSSLSNFKINFVMIKGINDNKNVWIEFVNNITQIKNKVKVRISRLNKTKSSQKHDLNPADVLDMERFSKILDNNEIINYIFYSNKNDNMNCGQLISEIHNCKN